MKKLGLVGGMGPESTGPYYMGIVYGVQKRMGERVFPHLTIESIDVFKMLRLCGEKAYDELTDYLLEAIENLAAAGADFAALSANTPHIVFDRLQARSPLPLVSIVDAAAEEAKRQKLQRVGLLGTEFTMNGAFFKKPFEDSGVQVYVPGEAEKELVNDRIARELELGIVKRETQEAFLNIIEGMQREHNIQAIILGCTELPMLFEGIELPLACLDTMQIHVEKLVDVILGERS